MTGFWPFKRVILLLYVDSLYKIVHCTITIPSSFADLPELPDQSSLTGCSPSRNAPHEVDGSTLSNGPSRDPFAHTISPLSRAACICQHKIPREMMQPTNAFHPCCWHFFWDAHPEVNGWIRRAHTDRTFTVSSFSSSIFCGKDGLWCLPNFIFGDFYWFLWSIPPLTFTVRTLLLLAWWAGCDYACKAFKKSKIFFARAVGSLARVLPLPHRICQADRSANIKSQWRNQSWSQKSKA